MLEGAPRGEEAAPSIFAELEDLRGLPKEEEGAFEAEGETPLKEQSPLEGEAALEDEGVLR